MKNIHISWSSLLLLIAIFVVPFFVIGFIILLYTFGSFGFSESFDLSLIFLGIPSIIFFILLFIFSSTQRKKALKELKNNVLMIIIAPFAMGWAITFIITPYTAGINAFIGKQEVKIVKAIVAQKNETEEGCNLDLKLEYDNGENRKMKVFRSYLNWDFTLKNMGLERISVNKDLYKLVKVGDTVNVKLRVGWLGIEYQFLSDKWDGKNVYLDEKVKNKEEKPDENNSN